MRSILATTAVVLLCTLAAVAAARRGHLPKSHELTADYGYEQYLADRGIVAQRRREPAALAAERQAVFTRNLKHVLKHNADPSATFKMTANKFFDWTDDELSAAGIKPNRMMRGLLHDALEAFGAPEASFKAASGNVTRSGFDYRNAVPPVLTTTKDQGLCGSCYAHATVESVESRHAIKHGVLNALSQQQIVSCVPNITYTAHMGNRSRTGQFFGCNGYLPNLVLNWLTSDAAFGPGNFVEDWRNPYRSFFVPEAGAANPFNITGGPPNPTVPTCDAWMPELPPLAVASGYTFVDFNTPQSFEEHLLNHGPVISVISLPCMELAYYEGGIFTCPQCVGGQYSPSHVINIVGWGEDHATGQSYWVVRNSWGADWGEGGYIRFARGVADTTCGHMLLPDNLNKINGTWGFQEACGMCGVLAVGIVPDVV